MKKQDGVIGVLTFAHSTDQLQYAREAFAVLKDSVYAVCTIHNMDLQDMV